MTAFRLVYRNPWNVLISIVAFVAMATFYLWSSQVVIVGRHGVTVLMQSQFVAAALVMSLLFGLLVPLLIYAARLAAASASEAGGTALGAICGTASMTCCAPVILPAILSLVGFSGTTILNVNATLNRFWLPLAVAGIILLLYSLVSVVQSLSLQCTPRTPADGVSMRRGESEPVSGVRVHRG